MDFTNSPPEWQNNGEEPSQSLKESGFTPGYKPPAAYFNWFWSKVSACITELQNKLLDVNTSKADADDIHTHANKTVLDGITSTKMSQWDTAYSQSHVHSNKTVLDGISSSDVSNWDNSAPVKLDSEPTRATAGIGGKLYYTEKSGLGTTVWSFYIMTADYGVDFGSSRYEWVNLSSFSQIQNYVENLCDMMGGGYNNINRLGIPLGGANNNILTYQVKAGHYATDGRAGSTIGTRGDAFIIGNGSTSARSNAFRVAYNGSVYGAGAYNSTGADIAELYEWLDGNPGNEDRRGLFVTLDGTKIKLAEPTDTYIKGVISAAPALVGDSYSDTWHGMYLTDVFGVPLKQTVHHDAEYMEVKKTDPETGEETTEQVLIHDEYDAEEYILNPDYDPEQEYIPREQRQEYDYVSSWGKLVIVDDGTCEVNGFATVGEGGKATKSDTQTIYRVMERKDDTHIFVAIG